MIFRGLIIRKQYLDLILYHGKTWEMRSRPTNIRGRIGLIEADSGLIVGEAVLTDCLPAVDTVSAAMSYNRHMVDNLGLLAKWRFPWVLQGARRYAEPIPYPHPPGAVTWVKIELPAVACAGCVNRTIAGVVCPENFQLKSCIPQSTKESK